MLSAIARLRPGQSLGAATAEATARAQAAPGAGPVAIAVFGSDGPPEITLVPLLEDATREVRPALLVLMAAVALLLAAAAGNVANIQLARATARRREMAIRGALGAHPSQLARLLLAEGAVVGVGGGLAGLLVAAVLHRALQALLPADFPRVDQIHLNWAVCTVAIGASLLAGLAAGLLPAWQACRTVPADLLAEDGLAPVGMGLRTRTALVRALVMAGQVAIATVLLSGAALLSRSFVVLLQADRGFQTSSVLTAELALPEQATPDLTLARRNALLNDLVDRMRGVPGVVAVGYTNILPLTDSESMGMDSFRDRNGRPATMRYGMRVVSDQYFAALGMRVLRGRAFSASDSATSQQVTIVNEAFAAAYLDSTPVGDVLSRDRQVVGVVNDIRGADAAPAGPELFIPATQARRTPGGNPVLVIRSIGRPAELTPVLRGLLRAIDHALALGEVITMEDRVLSHLARPRLYSVMLAGFAALAFAIAGAGLFGVLSYTVAQRTRELAVRSAVGAPPRALLGLVVRHGLMVTSAGIAGGTLIAIALAESISPFLYGVSARDPLTYLIVAALLLGMALLACVAPALRAARLDVLVVLRRG